MSTHSTGHAESWLSAAGRMIIREARKKDMIGAIVFDELQKSLRWKMRPRMQDTRWFIDARDKLLSSTLVNSAFFRLAIWYLQLPY